MSELDKIVKALQKVAIVFPKDSRIEMTISADFFWNLSYQEIKNEEWSTKKATRL